MSAAVTVNVKGREPFTVSEHELARGERDLKRQLSDIRQASPGMVVIDDFEELAPIRLVEISLHGVRVPMYVDPLDLLQRVGFKSEIPAALAEAASGIEGDWA